MHPFEAKLSASWPPESWQDFSVIVAVSGGADSVALLRSLLSIPGSKNGRLVVAHFNHKLRGAESDADAAWVCGLANALSVTCEMEEADEALADQADGDGIEAAARNAR